MKGLKKIPSLKDLTKAYNLLHKSLLSEKSPTEADLVRLSQWVRFDPTLGEIIVTVVEKYWRTLSPLKLNSQITSAPWAAVFGVILETSKLNLSKSDLTFFIPWSKLVMTSVEKAHNEQFFIGLNHVTGARMMKEATHTLKIYQNWGYLSSELMINKARANRNRTTISKKNRLYVLSELLRKQKIITVADYLNTLPGLISPRQAERDLKEHPNLIGKGHTQKRKYFVQY